MPETTTIEAPVTTTETTITPPAPSEPGAWRMALPEDIRSSPSISKYNDVPSLAKSYLELEKKLGEPKLPVPQANWTEKEYGEFYGKLGRPDRPEGYGFKPVENLPPGITYSPDQDKWFSEQAHKLGLSSAQATALREQFVNMQMEKAKTFGDQTKESQAKQQAELDKIKMDYGTKYDAAADAAFRVVQEMGGKEAQEFLASTGLGNHPVLVRMMMKIGQTLQDHSVITGIPRISGAFTSSPSQAQAELAKMDADPETRKILTTAQHPQHDALVKRRAELMRSMVPIEK